MAKPKSARQVFMAGIVEENPILVLMIGLCPLLAVSSNANDALGMGVAASFVLVASNVLISLLRKVIPASVRIPIFIVIVATFVTLIDLLMHAYQPGLYKNLGVFVPLIVVNCIILGRAEAFASRNTVGRSVLDGLGMGLGFCITLLLFGAVREVLGSGSLLGIELFGPNFQDWVIMVLPPGGFFVLGAWLLFFAALERRKQRKLAEATQNA